MRLDDLGGCGPWVLQSSRSPCSAATSCSPLSCRAGGRGLSRQFSVRIDFLWWRFMPASETRRVSHRPGHVTALKTVTVRTQVDGQLTESGISRKVTRAGSELLAQNRRPRPFQVQTRNRQKVITTTDRRVRTRSQPPECDSTDDCKRP